MPKRHSAKRRRRSDEPYPQDISEASFQSDIVWAARLNGWRIDVEDCQPSYRPRVALFLARHFKALNKPLKWLLGRRNGCFTLAYHTHDSRASQAGFPDLVLVHPRRQLLVFAELKTNTNYPSTEQRLWLAGLECATSENSNIRVCVWKPKHWDNIIKLLGGIDPTLL